MTHDWREMMDELHGDDPGRVARVDQIRAAMRDRENRWYWRLVRWWDRWRGR